jgi:hypothetical protein
MMMKVIMELFWIILPMGVEVEIYFVDKILTLFEVLTNFLFFALTKYFYRIFVHKIYFKFPPLWDSFRKK